CVHLSGPVTIDTPSHGEQGMLADHFHLLDGTVTGFTLDTTNRHVLGVVEIGKVGKVMNTYPFDRFVFIVGANNFGNLGLSRQGTTLDLVVTVHTDVHRGNGGVLALRNT